ncbi:MAG: hypothetical protein R2751_07815 [Bacteroidales bacterium]
MKDNFFHGKSLDFPALEIVFQDAVEDFVVVIFDRVAGRTVQVVGAAGLRVVPHHLLVGGDFPDQFVFDQHVQGVVYRPRGDVGVVFPDFREDVFGRRVVVQTVNRLKDGDALRGDFQPLLSQ